MKRILPLLVLFSLFFSACDECVDEQTPPAGSGVDLSQVITGNRPVCSRVAYCVSIGPGFSADEIDQIDEALEDWHVSTGGVVSFVEDSSKDPLCIPVKIKAEERKWFVAQGLNVRTKGYTVDGTIHLSIDELCGSKKFSLAVRHEFGHVLGIPHLNDTDSIMYPSYDEETSPSTIQTIDVETYFNLKGCEPGVEV